MLLQTIFFLNGTFTPSNTNPRIFHEAHNQYSEKLNAWTGIYGNRTVCHFFLTCKIQLKTFILVVKRYRTPITDWYFEKWWKLYCKSVDLNGILSHYAFPVRQYLCLWLPGQWTKRTNRLATQFISIWFFHVGYLNVTYIQSTALFK